MMPSCSNKLCDGSSQCSSHPSLQQQSQPVPTTSAVSAPAPRRSKKTSTLTATQLARKREKDRESQRAARNRTKLRMGYLEKELEELRKQDVGNKTIQHLLERNAALETELARIRWAILHRKPIYFPHFSEVKPPQRSISDQNVPGLSQHQEKSMDRQGEYLSPLTLVHAHPSNDANIHRYQNSWHPNVSWQQQHQIQPGDMSDTGQSVFSPPAESLMPNIAGRNSSMCANSSVLPTTSLDGAHSSRANKNYHQYTSSASDPVSSSYIVGSSPHSDATIEATGEPGCSRYQRNSMEGEADSNHVQSLLPPSVEYQSLQSTVELEDETPGGGVGQGQPDDSNNAWRGYFSSV